MGYIPKLDENIYIWNPWHGCRMCSIGCEHCYLYINDKQYGKDPEKVYKALGQFKLPLSTQRGKKKDPVTNRCDVQYKIPSASIIDVCNSSDFFIEDADNWRDEAWNIIHQRSDCLFRIITKRPENIRDRLPSDWSKGYDNVAICITAETEELAWSRSKIILDLPIKHIGLWLEPLFEYMDIRPFLSSFLIENVTIGGESYQGLFKDSRPLHMKWVRDIRNACKEYEVTFKFLKTGSIFVNDDNVKLEVKKRDERGLAEFFRLDIPEFNGINWDTLPDELAQRTLDQEAYNMYRVLKDEYLYYI